MKNNIVLSLFMVLATSSLVLLNSCSKILNSLSIHKTYSTIEFTIPSPQVAGSFELEQTIDADLQQLAATNGFDINKIESATVNSISLIINDTTSVPVTFAIVDKASCEFSADNVTFAEVGSDDATHTSPTQIDFDMKGLDVSPYLKASSYKVKLKMTTNAPINHDVPMKATIDCTFKVKPLK